MISLGPQHLEGRAAPDLGAAEQPDNDGERQDSQEQDHERGPGQREGAAEHEANERPACERREQERGPRGQGSEDGVLREQDPQELGAPGPERAQQGPSRTRSVRLAATAPPGRPPRPRG